MANVLNDGNPLTYEWLNNLVVELNAVKHSQDRYANNTKVTFVPDHLATKGTTLNIQFLTGKAMVSLNKGESFAKSRVKFSNAFLDKPMIIPSINFTNNANDVLATVWATNIDETGFMLNAYRFGKLDNKKATPITVSYIAIGKSKATS